MGALVLMIVLVSLSVGICVLAVRIGSRPDSSLGELVDLHRLRGLPNPGLHSDWPASRDELRSIATYRFRSRPRA